MASINDYVHMTLEELRSAEEKLKSQKIMTAVLMGLFVGIAVFAAVRGKALLTFALLVFSLLIGNGYSKQMKEIQAEIQRRETEG